MVMSLLLGGEWRLLLWFSVSQTLAHQRDLAGEGDVRGDWMPKLAPSGRPRPPCLVELPTRAKKRRTSIRTPEEERPARPMTSS